MPCTCWDASASSRCNAADACNASGGDAAVDDDDSPADSSDSDTEPDSISSFHLAVESPAEAGEDEESGIEVDYFEEILSCAVQSHSTSDL